MLFVSRLPGTCDSDRNEHDILPTLQSSSRAAQAGGSISPYRCLVAIVNMVKNSR